MKLKLSGRGEESELPETLLSSFLRSRTSTSDGMGLFRGPRRHHRPSMKVSELKVN